MLKSIPFLQPNPAQIRHQIRNILESYNHDWDLVAELAQNSVDAIYLEQPTKGHMRLTIDAPNKRITFDDNGCGIPPDDLPGLLAPFSSNKGQAPNLIGYKGVGISFVIFSSAHFEIHSHHSTGSSRATIDGAAAWLDADSDDLPDLAFDNSIEPRATHGTTISIRLPDAAENKFFSLSPDQIEMILRTRTAIGATATIWGASVDKDLSLSFIDLNGEIHEREMDCSYFLPTSGLSPKEFISLRDFQEWNTGDRSDSQKREKLRDKLVYLDGQKEQAGRRIRYWSCFVPKRKAWDVLSVRYKLVDESILRMNPIARSHEYSDSEWLFSGGMFTSTKGMPTGIRSDMRAKGSAGYLPNFFIVLEDPLLSFDIGRKSIPGRQLGMLRDIASDVFRDFISGVRKYIGGEPESGEDGWNRTSVFNEIRSMPDLPSQTSKFLKRPSSQEATVAAIFFELLGNGTITDFAPYIAGYKNKYDLYSKFRTSDVVVEFKYALSALFRDFDDETKLFDEIDIVVVWEITEKDYEIVKSRSLDLQEVEPGLTTSQESVFHYKLFLGPTHPIRIVCLRRLL